MRGEPPRGHGFFWTKFRLKSLFSFPSFVSFSFPPLFFNPPSPSHSPSPFPLPIFLVDTEGVENRIRRNEDGQIVVEDAVVFPAEICFRALSDHKSVQIIIIRWVGGFFYLFFIFLYYFFFVLLSHNPILLMLKK